MIGFKTLVTAALLIIGGLLVINQEMNIGQFVAAEIVILLMISSVEKLILGLENVYDILTATEKIGLITDLPLEEHSENKPFKKDDEFTVELVRTGVEFEHSNKRVIDDVSLTINPKERILISGPSGSGKTTLLKIIAGLITRCDGQMLINDINFVNINNEHYRSFVGHVFPNNLPFDGTIRENITFNNPKISEEKLREILKVLGLEKFVKSQAKGLETVISSDGNQLSYTAKRKIILARALVTEPKFLIMKDPLNEFDEKEIDRILAYIFDKKHDWTVIVSSKNEIWRKYCERVIELENGLIK
jgi:ABC-type bacteriocin/lantibiotic exporter with double-glycine peptidase domain